MTSVVSSAMDKGVSFFHQDLVEGIDDVCFTTIYSIQNELGVQVATSG
jgi:hypothetical protein